MTKTVTIEQIDRFNKMIDAVKGKHYYYILDMMHEVKEDPNPKWFFMGHGKIYLPVGSQPYIKTIKGKTYIYADAGRSTYRWAIESDLQKAYFGIGEE